MLYGICQSQVISLRRNLQDLVPQAQLVHFYSSRTGESLNKPCPDPQANFGTAVRYPNALIRVTGRLSVLFHYNISNEGAFSKAGVEQSGTAD